MNLECARGECPRKMRVAFAGDSITWGDGMLDDGFVGEADRYIRKTYAETLASEQLNVSGTAEALSSRKLYGGRALRLTGAGSAVSFELEGDELTVVQAMERGNGSASLIDVYVDGALFDTFSNRNEAPCGEDTIRFVADGAGNTFDLGRPFTYAHSISADGRPVVGGLNCGGYGAAFPADQDYRVIRIYGSDAHGETEVHHALQFRRTPAQGIVIEASFRYGETIAYAKTTVGETEERFGSPLESRYGEGGVAFDPARPVAVSSGLDYRITDDRAVRTWTFPDTRRRTFELKIRGFDPLGGKTGDPYLIVNFVTNRFHSIMNAGIGGWTANLYKGDKGLRNVNGLCDWKPDILFIGLGTNDDWEAGNTFAAVRRIEGLSEADVRRLPTLLIQNCRYDGPDRYSVDTAELIVAACEQRCVVLDGTGASFDSVKQGDLVVVGDYYGDNRNVQSRLIESWDPDTRTARFTEPLEPTPLTPHIEDYAGQAIRIKRVDGFVTALERMLAMIRTASPATRLALIETGLSNYNTRLLMGYPEVIRDIAKRYGAELVNVYRPLMQWQYEQPLDFQGYIGPGEQQRSGGSSEYPLVTPDGRDMAEAVRYQLRNWSVRIDGREKYGDGCRIEGGYALAFLPGTEPEQLTITDWNGRGRNPKVGYRFIPSRLVFTRDVPPPGARIEVSASPAKWSMDDAHLGMPGGNGIYAAQVKAAIRRMIGRE
ncbi:hypothetical protein [Paenibacillus oceani]|uniref:Uncharacterized protein n=1 Tax=Paenibacillus oceani TaxID=2772510 RepID=A0A927CB23_9BACL|nr:hypothetical protein [Paenibacillus oceani]MBD2862986.1 hypothetical protein [Paenibacillus oceani]